MSDYSASKIADWFLVRHSSTMQRDEAVDEYLTQMKLHKLLYYAQGVYLALFSKRLFNDDILAWQHGPVVRDIYDRFKGSRELDENITDDEMKNYEKILEDTNRNMVLEVVYETYSSYSAGQLRNMTHEEDPWKEAWGKSNGDDIISDESIKEYFKENIVETD